MLPPVPVLEGLRPYPRRLAGTDTKALIFTKPRVMAAVATKALLAFPSNFANGEARGRRIADAYLCSSHDCELLKKRRKLLVCLLVSTEQVALKTQINRFQALFDSGPGITLSGARCSTLDVIRTKDNYALVLVIRLCAVSSVGCVPATIASTIGDARKRVV